MQNFGQPNPYMGQYGQQYDPNMMGQYGQQFDPNMMGQYGQQFDPNMMGQQFGQQFDPNSVMPPEPQAPQGGYGHQWAQYEDQAAQYSPTNTVEGENAAIGDPNAPAEGEQAGGEEADPYAVDENDQGGMNAAMFGYDPSYISEFGAAAADPYGYNPYADIYGYQEVPYIDGDQPLVEQRWRAHPVLVFSLMLICFPIGLALMLFFTDWGAFAKIYTTLFVLAMALIVYEILVNKQVVAAPSIIQTVKDMLGALPFGTKLR